VSVGLIVYKIISTGFIIKRFIRIPAISVLFVILIERFISFASEVAIDINIIKTFPGTVSKIAKQIHFAMTPVEI
jgi:hypothetical protein